MTPAKEWGKKEFMHHALLLNGGHLSQLADRLKKAPGDILSNKVNSSHELKLMGFRLSCFQAALRQVPGDSSLLSLQPRLSGQFLPF